MARTRQTARRCTRAFPSRSGGYPQHPKVPQFKEFLFSRNNIQNQNAQPIINGVYVSDVGSVYQISSLLKECLSRAPKDFRLVTHEGQPFLFNKIILSNTSHLIKRELEENPQMESYTLLTEDTEPFLGKLAQLLDGDSVKFVKAEKKISRKVAKELEIGGFPSWMSPKEPNSVLTQPVMTPPPKFIFLIISPHTFIFYLKETKTTINIETRHNKYQVPYIGALCSPLIAENIINSSPDSETTTFFFDIDDEDRDFDAVAKFMTGENLELTAKNIQLCLKSAEMLQIEKLTLFIQNAIKEHDERNQIIEDNQFMMNDVQILMKKLQNLTDDTVNKTFEFLLDSVWVSEKERVKEMISYILLASSFLYRVHRPLAKLCILLDDAKKVKDALTIFRRFLNQKLFLDFQTLNCFNNYTNYTIQQTLTNNFCQLILYLKKLNFLTSREIVQEIKISEILRNQNNKQMTAANLMMRFGENAQNQIALNFLQVFFSTEINEVYPNLVPENMIVPDLQRFIEGPPGSLLNIIYNDDLEEFLKISSLPDFELTQTIKFPSKFSFDDLSILEVAARLGSPKIFFDVVQRLAVNNQINCKIINDDDIDENDNNENNPNDNNKCAILDWKILGSAIGSDRSIFHFILDNLDYIIQTREKNNATSFGSISVDNVSFLIEYLSIAVHKFDDEMVEYASKKWPRPVLLSSVCEAAHCNNFTAFKILNSNIFIVDRDKYSTCIRNSIFNDCFVDFFIFLTKLFKITSLIDIKSLILASMNRHNNNALINSFLDNVANFGSIRLFKYIWENMSKKTDIPLGPVVVSSSYAGNLDFIEFCINDLKVELRPKEIMRVVTNMYVMKRPEIAKVLYESMAEVPEKLVIHLLEVACGTNDLKFIERLIERQLEIKPDTSFDLAFDEAARKGNLEVSRLLVRYRVTDLGLPMYHQSIVGIIRDFDYYSNLNINKSTTNENTTNENTNVGEDRLLEIIRLYVGHLQGESLEEVVRRGLYESIQMKLTSLIAFLLTFNVGDGNSFVAAARYGMIDVVRRLYTFANSPLTFVNHNHPMHGTALHAACEGGHIEVVQFLLSLPAIDLSTRNPSGHSAIVISALNRHFAIFSILFKTGKFSRLEINRSFLAYCHNMTQSRPPISSSAPSQYSLLAEPAANEAENKARQIQLYNSMLNHQVSTEELYAEFPNLEYQYGGVIFRNIPKVIPIKLDENPEFFEFFSHSPLIGYDFYDQKETFLIAACRYNRSELVKLLLKKPKTNVNAYDNCGNTALIYSVVQNSIKNVKILLENKFINLNHQNFFKRTALSFAAYYNHLEILNYLINHPKFDPEKSLVKTALAAAIIQSHREIINVLMKIDFDINSPVCFDQLVGSDPASRQRLLQTPNHNVNIFNNTFHSNGKTMNKKPKEFSFFSLMRIAVQRDDLTTLKLIPKHPRFDPVESKVSSALLHAARRQSLDVFVALLEISGKDVNFVYKNQSLLCVAALSQSEAIIDYIINSPQFDPVLSKCETAFFMSLVGQYYNGIEKLSKIKGININSRCPKLPQSLLTSLGGPLYSRNVEGMTPLSIVSITSADALSLLLKRPDIDVNSRNADGSTPIFHALQMPTCLDLLLKEKKLDINAQDDSGKTCLMHMAISRSVQYASSILARKDVDLSIVDKEGKNALNYANPTLEDIDPKEISWKEATEIFIQSVFNQHLYY